MRRTGWRIVAVLIVATVTALQIVEPFSRPRDATAIGSIDKPFVLSTPLFTPKDGSNSTLVFASMNDAGVVVNLRRYNAVGGLLSSTNVTLGAKSSIIAFAGANSGAQMHIEIWSPTPYFTMEVTYTDPGSVVQRITYGNMLLPHPATSAFVALSPTLACDTRNNGNSTSCAAQRLGSGATRTFGVIGLGGIPSSVKSVTLMVQVVSPTTRSWLTFYPAGTTKPDVMHVFFEAGTGKVNSEQFTVAVSPSGQVSFTNNAGSVDAIVHVAGYHALV
jgi:hypothetical protein